MTLVDNAENLASPGLAEPYAASPTRSLLNLTWNSVTEMGTAENAAAAVLTESEMNEEGETTSVVHHLQRDSENHCVNTECDLLVDRALSPSRTNCSDDEGLLFRMPNLLVNTAGGIMSPPRLNFFSEEAPFLTPNFHADMVGGMMMSTSPPRMNYFSPPSGDSIGNSDPYRLWNFADHSEAQELENRKGMTMRPTCIKEVDAVLGQKNQILGIWASENMGGTVQQSCWGTHPHPQPQTSDDDSVNNVDEWFQLAGGMMATSPTMMTYSLRDAGEYSVIREFRYVKRVVKVTVSWNDSELLSHNESLFEYCLNIDVQAMEKGLLVAHTDYVHFFWKFKCTAVNLIEFEVGARKAWMKLKSVTHPPSGKCDGFNVNDVVEFLEKDFVQTILLQLLFAARRIAKRAAVMDNIATVSADANMAVNLWNLCACISKALPEAEFKMMHLDRPWEGHIPESSATNEERNNVAELNNNSIDDAKGGNSSSDKTDTISRWEKDHGITRQVLQQLFGKSRDDAAKTLTARLVHGMNLKGIGILFHKEWNR